MKLEDLGFDFEELAPDIVKENDLYLSQVVFPPDPNKEGDKEHPHLSFNRVRLRHHDRFEFECLTNGTKYFSLGTHYYGKTQGMIVKQKDGKTKFYIDKSIILR